jgi:sigma-B regulation protein RsbU (phosphoserine phosphatase)
MACCRFPRLCRDWFFAIAIATPLGFFATAQPAQSKLFDATNLRGPVDLPGPWLVHAGDDPAFARPDFDDSSWTPFDAQNSLKTLYPQGDPESVWYRLHMKVAVNQTGMALAESYISSAFEVYANGQLVIKSGSVKPYKRYTYSASLVAPISDRQIASGSLVIALRVYISASEWKDRYPGFTEANLVLGQEDALREHLWLRMFSQVTLRFFNHCFGLGLAIVALALFNVHPRQKEYLWIFLGCTCEALQMPFEALDHLRNIPAVVSLLREPLNLGAQVFAVFMYLAMLRVRLGRRGQLLLTLGVCSAAFTDIGGYLGRLSDIASVLGPLPLTLILSLAVPVMLVVHWRRGNREAGILLIPSLLSSSVIDVQMLLLLLSSVPLFTARTLRLLELISSLHAGPFILQPFDISNTLYGISLAVIMVVRSTESSRQQAHLEGELAAARAIQQVIVPEAIESVPGFELEAVYQPAQQVGGDFFQILPTAEGGLLVVVGDVAGKGLPAALLVSVLVGAIRGVSEYTKDPAELLANLNERLVGRGGGGFSTALIAVITTDGHVTIANAGHLSPYLDGEEVEILGALPLGVVNGVKYETTRIQMAPGSRLTFYSDGVIEAQRPGGELFGFDRARDVSMKPAAEIVEAAKRFGQEDDITVVTVRLCLAQYAPPQDDCGRVTAEAEVSTRASLPG